PSLAAPLERGAVHALAHVTGGGIAGNLVRVLPAGCRARVQAGAWSPPAVFRWLIATGEVPVDDARETWNLGIGLVVVCAPEMRDELARECERAGETVTRLGDIVAGERGVEWVG